MSLSADLCLGTVDAIASRLELEETVNTPLASAMDGSPVGAHRVLARDGVAALVYVGMTVEAFGLDSHMCFAFTPATSPVPHFTVDSVLAGPHYAFHLDLIPRVDPGANLAYIDHCYSPLTEVHDETMQIEGLTRLTCRPANGSSCRRGCWPTGPKRTVFGRCSVRLPPTVTIGWVWWPTACPMTP